MNSTPSKTPTDTPEGCELSPQELDAALALFDEIFVQLELPL